MEPKELDWPLIIQAIAGAIITIYLAIINNKQKKNGEELQEVKHLVNSTQTNLQTSINDLRTENQGLRQDKVDMRADHVGAAPEVQKVEVVSDPTTPVHVVETKPEEGE